MKILHTSDWHLGKTLEGFSRLYEQERFIDELVDITDKNRVDLIIIAGDIYDSFNPPAAAEKLFYSALKRLSGDGRVILITAGNHDHPDRLTAAGPLAYDSGVILLGTPLSVAHVGRYGHYAILDAGEGFVELEINGECAVVITMPYPSEKRLNELIPADSQDEAALRKSYSDRVRELFEKLTPKYRRDTINIAVGHFYVHGGHTSDSERDISIGGAYAVSRDALPEGACYIALGHLHRPQEISEDAYYSGSPLQYSKSETGYAKCVMLAELKPGVKADISKVYISCAKPIEVISCASIEEALQICESGRREVWAYFDIQSDRTMMQHEIKQMRSSGWDIVDIHVRLPGIGAAENTEESAEEKSVTDEFADFYERTRGVKPPEDIMKLFIELIREEEEHEAD